MRQQRSEAATGNALITRVDHGHFVFVSTTMSLAKLARGRQAEGGQSGGHQQLFLGLPTTFSRRKQRVELVL